MKWIKSLLWRLKCKFRLNRIQSKTSKGLQTVAIVEYKNQIFEIVDYEKRISYNRGTLVNITNIRHIFRVPRYNISFNNINVLKTIRRVKTYKVYTTAIVNYKPIVTLFCFDEKEVLLGYIQIEEQYIKRIKV